VGLDLFCWAEDRDAVRAALPFPDGDEAAAEVVRVESGRPRYGVDLDETDWHQLGKRPHTKNQAH